MKKISEREKLFKELSKLPVWDKVYPTENDFLNDMVEFILNDRKGRSTTGMVEICQSGV